MSENIFLGDSTYPHESRAAEYLCNKFGAYRGHHAWRDIEAGYEAGAVEACKFFNDRIEQLERELEDAKKLSDLDALDLAVGRQINRAARDLPMWFGIVISIEKDAGDVVMTDPDGNEFGNFEGDSFAWQISKAIDAAILGGESMKVTGWFKGHQKPVRVGVYQRKYGLNIWYCYWDGENFCLGCVYAQDAALYKTQASTLQNSAWRGITNEVKA